MSKGTYETTIDYFGDEGVITLEIKGNWSIDEGYWRNANGDGLPPSDDLDYEIISAVNEDGIPIPVEVAENLVVHSELVKMIWEKISVEN